MKCPVVAQLALAAAILWAPAIASADTIKLDKVHHVHHRRYHAVRGTDAAVSAPVVQRRSADPCADENITMSTFGNCNKLSGAGS